MKRRLDIFTALSFALVATSGTAMADNDFSVHLEPGLAVPLSSPQGSIYDPGVVLGAKGMFTLTPNFSIGPSLSTLYLPRVIDNGQNAGVLWQAGGSARLQGDRRVSNTSPFFSAVNPWIDADLTAAFTGNLVLPALDVGVGAEFPLDQNHIAWFGPFVRYTHVFQTSDTDLGLNLDSRDVNILQAGVSLSFDTPTTPKVQRVVQHDVAPCPQCRDEKTVIVAASDKLNLSEKVYFDFDSSHLRWESNDKLDTLVKTLNAHPTLKIHVQGNASADGQLAHNQQLAVSRAVAVVSYLVAHGVDGKRLETNPMGVDNPTASNATKEGRERNRRVEFVVQFTSVDSQTQGKNK